MKKRTKLAHPAIALGIYVLLTSCRLLLCFGFWVTIGLRSVDCWPGRRFMQSVAASLEVPVSKPTYCERLNHYGS